MFGVLRWFEFPAGGSCGEVQAQLQDVQQLHASAGAFSAILADGRALSWGHPGHGGDSRDVQHQLQNVQEIQASRGAFAAIVSDA